MQPAIDLADLRGLRYRCLEGCGFCCTFTPEVSSEELARLRTRFPRLPVVEAAGGVRHLAFQGGCGACVLLERRACTGYDVRPAHCRHFPFHVHFGRRPSALVNRACRGVEDDPAGDLTPQFGRDVLALVPAADLRTDDAEARAVFAEFDDNCRAAGVAGDAVPAASAALARDLSWDGLRALAAEMEAPLEDAWEAALAPLHEEDVVARPFYLARDLRWWTFRPDDGALRALEMQEEGTLAPGPLLARPRPGEGLDPARLRKALAFFVARAPFEGQVAWIVDESDYEVSVAEAARVRLLELALEAQWRAQVLRGLGVPEPELDAEVVRFLDGAFLDAPTIAGWL